MNTINTTSNHSILGVAPMNGSYTTSATNPLSELMENVGSKISRDYRIDLTKAENGGFVIQVYKTNTPDAWSAKPKIYINTEIENLGRDIQNALMLEIMKS